MIRQCGGRAGGGGIMTISDLSEARRFNVEGKGEAGGAGDLPSFSKSGLQHRPNHIYVYMAWIARSTLDQWILMPDACDGSLCFGFDTHVIILPPRSWGGPLEDE